MRIKINLSLLLVVITLLNNVLSQKPALYPVVRNNKAGFIDKEGKLIIPCKFDGADEFNDFGIAEIYLNGKSGLIDQKGTILVLEKMSSVISSSSKNYFVFRIGEIYRDPKALKIYNPAGKLVSFPTIQINTNDFSVQIKNGAAVVEVAGKIGVQLENGSYLLEPEYDYIKLYNDGIIAQKGETFEVFNYTKNLLFKSKYDFTSSVWSNGLITFSDLDKKFGLMNLKGEEICAPKYNYISGFNGGLSKALLPKGKFENQFVYIDTTGEVKINMNFERFDDFSEGFARVSTDEKNYGLVDTKGNWFLQPHYKGDFIFKNGTVLITKKISDDNFQIQLLDKNADLLSNIQTTSKKEYIDLIYNIDIHGVINFITGTSDDIYTIYRINKEGKIIDKRKQASCFPVNAYIQLHNGETKAIQEIQRGDTLQSISQSTPFIIVDELEIQTGVQNMVAITFDDPFLLTASVNKDDLFTTKQLISTSSHPILTQRGIVLASKIRRGDILSNYDHTTNKIVHVKVSNVEISPSETVTVYNIRANGLGYFVNGVAVMMK
jgi:hypothetical protein